MSAGPYRAALLLLLLGVLLGVLPQYLPAASASDDMNRLHSDLMATYNRFIRPVRNNSDLVTVRMGLRLSQLIDVNMKHQIMTTSVWVDQEWSDYKLSWDPADYGGVTRLYVPAEDIWLPDIVLYNNADGNYEITILTKAELHASGRVKWRPPAVYKSYCQIDVQYFPFDQQNCIMKFGSWTYDDHMLDLQHAEQNSSDLDSAIHYGINLHDYYLSVEWDVMQVPAVRHKVFYYSCCQESLYIDISFNVTLRRKSVFYTVNLIIPCVGISCLTVLVFYLPAESGEKVSLCISILLSLTVFFLLLAEIIPPTSLTVPLLGKYLLFTMTLVTLSVMSTICVLNIGFRSPSTHRMSARTRWLFLQFLPPLLLISRPAKAQQDELDETALEELDEPPELVLSAPALPGGSGLQPSSPPPSTPSSESSASCQERWEARQTGGQPAPPGEFRLQSALHGLGTIARRMNNRDCYEEVEADWHYVAMVLDRLFLWVFTVACVSGSCGILLQAPALYDHTTPIDRYQSRVARADLASMGDDDQL